ncbi:hypothetical protein L1887_43662 [Cichorium endivia]|nr:hypothetical protein L1887_43662 [Cichorium endivia]
MRLHPLQYKQKVESSNPSNVSALVLEHLRQCGVQAFPVKRGIDHGVWCPLKVAFQKPFLEDLPSGNAESQSASINDPSQLPPTLSLTQLSLPASDSSLDSLKLGAALRRLRDQGFAIVGGGMSVHNLREAMKAFALVGRGFGALQPTSYSSSFLSALTEAMTAPRVSRDEEKWAKAINLDKRHDFLPSHPTPEHFLLRARPFLFLEPAALVALGAAHSDEQGVETFALDEGPMGCESASASVFLSIGSSWLTLRMPRPALSTITGTCTGGDEHRPT